MRSTFKRNICLRYLRYYPSYLALWPQLFIAHFSRKQNKHRTFILFTPLTGIKHISYALFRPTRNRRVDDLVAITGMNHFYLGIRNDLDAFIHNCNWQNALLLALTVAKIFDYFS